MKKHILVYIASLCFTASIAQQNFNDSIAYSRNHTTEKAMIVLGSWAAVNIASGFIVAGQVQGEAKYFWKMNAYWNLINGGLAVMGYLNARKAMAKKFGLAENEAAQAAIGKLYAFNFGLDFAYIAGGFFLREKCRVSTRRLFSRLCGRCAATRIRMSKRMLVSPSATSGRMRATLPPPSWKS